jgi:hypothetical protein
MLAHPDNKNGISKSLRFVMMPPSALLSLEAIIPKQTGLPPFLNRVGHLRFRRDEKYPVSLPGQGKVPLPPIGERGQKET